MPMSFITNMEERVTYGYTYISFSVDSE